MDLGRHEDAGPFTSGFFRAGRFRTGPDGRAEFVAHPDPDLLAAANGLKIESLALRPSADDTADVF